MRRSVDSTIPGATLRRRDTPRRNGHAEISTRGFEIVAHIAELETTIRARSRY